jgi:hypothetical protein
MSARNEDTTATEVATVYDAIVALGDAGDLVELSAGMRREFQRRTGSYGPEDPWFETRSRAFWDDALVTQGFAALVADRTSLGARARLWAERMTSAHRGFFLVEEIADDEAHLVDVWSGAELLVRPLDETQALTLEHSEGAVDARIVADPERSGALFILPGAYHHPADALEPAIDVLVAARERGMTTGAALDALLRMELVLRASSRVKAGFAYRVDHLDRSPSEASKAAPPVR